MFDAAHGAPRSYALVDTCAIKCETTTDATTVSTE
jgi:hypothetical protein